MHLHFLRSNIIITCLIRNQGVLSNVKRYESLTWAPPSGGQPLFPEPSIGRVFSTSTYTCSVASQRRNRGGELLNWPLGDVPRLRDIPLSPNSMTKLGEAYLQDPVKASLWVIHCDWYLTPHSKTIFCYLPVSLRASAIKSRVQQRD